MKLASLEIENFKTIKKTTIEFGDGITIVKGPNEAGKSTLIQAIVSIFFLAPASSATGQLIRWGGQIKPRIAAHLSTDGKSFTLEKDFNEKRALLRSNDLSIEETNKERMGRFVQSSLGCPSEKFFLSTVCIRHDEIHDLRSTEIGKLLERTVLAVPEGETFETVVNDLTKEINGLKKGLTRGGQPGPIKALEDEMRGLTELKRSKDERILALDQSREKVKKVRVDIELQEKELQAARELEKGNSKLIDISNQLKSCEKEYARLSKLLEKSEELERINSKITDLDNLDESSVDAIASARKFLEEKELLLKDYSARKPLNEPRSSIFINIPLVTGVALLISSLIGAFWIRSLLVISLFAVLFLVFSVIYLKKSSSDVGSVLSNKIADLQKDKEKAKKMLADLIATAGYDTYESFASKREMLLSLQDRKRQAKAALDAVLGSSKLEEIEKEKKSLALEMERVKDLVSQYSGKKMDPIELQKLSLKISEISENLNTMKNELGAAELFIQTGTEESEEIFALEEKVQEAGEKLASLYWRLGVMETVREAMECASKGVRSTMTSLLEKSMADNISEITEGRYGQVEVDPGNLKMRAFSVAKGEFIDVDRDLSSATIEQFYLCARLGLIEHLTGGKKPPLILDDPFQYFDKKRKNKTMQILRKLARDQQIIIFTHSDDLDNFADKILILKEEA